MPPGGLWCNFRQPLSIISSLPTVPYSTPSHHSDVFCLSTLRRSFPPISFRLVSSHLVSSHLVSSHFISSRPVPFRFVPFRLVPLRFPPLHLTPLRSVPFHSVLFCSVLFRLVSFRHSFGPDISAAVHCRGSAIYITRLDSHTGLSSNEAPMSDMCIENETCCNGVADRERPLLCT